MHSTISLAESAIEGLIESYELNGLLHHTRCQCGQCESVAYGREILLLIRADRELRYRQSINATEPPLFAFPQTT